MRAHYVILALIAGISFPVSIDIRIPSVIAGVLIALSFWRPELRLWAGVATAFVLGVLRASFGPWELWFVGDIRILLEAMRDIFAARISLILPEPHASYLNGLLLGLRGDIPIAIRDAFRDTGTSHLIALSGYNVTIITSYLGKIFSGFWVPVVGVVLFVLGTGAQSSLVRAALMGILVLGAQKLGKKYTPTRALLLAATLMILFEPTILFEDVGFQLSVAATAGLIYLTPMIEPYFKWLTNKWSVRESLVVTLAAQAATFPIIFYYFGSPSLWSPFVNVLVIVTIPAVMFFGFVAGVAAFVHTTIGIIAVSPAYALLLYQLFIIEFFAKL
ncbi:MAG: ComEC/Rec2 family competence protein [bacterium]|nr:ComEC/Rec2 family competence protein [bacterium]